MKLALHGISQIIDTGVTLCTKRAGELLLNSCLVIQHIFMGCLGGGFGLSEAFFTPRSMITVRVPTRASKGEFAIAGWKGSEGHKVHPGAQNSLKLSATHVIPRVTASSESPAAGVGRATANHGLFSRRPTSGYTRHNWASCPSRG